MATKATAATLDASLWLARLSSVRLLRLCSCHARSTNAWPLPAKVAVKTLMSIEQGPTNTTAVEVVIIVDTIQIEIITSKQIIRVEELLACATLVASAPHPAAATADAFAIKETILAMLESIALHGHLVERKFVLYRQLVVPGIHMRR